jgi:predicted AlkP superfamily phosphohydrolase/phosphomutase
MGAVGGLCAGLLLGVFSWIYYQVNPQPGLDFVSHTGVAGFLATISLSVVAHSFVGVVLSVIILVLCAPFRYTPRGYFAASLAFASSIGLYALVLFFVRWNLSLPASISLADPIRAGILRQSILYGLGAAAVTLMLGLVLFSRIRTSRPHWVLAVVLVLSIAYYGVHLIGINTGSLNSREITEADPAKRQAGKVVLIGLDGGTWQVLEPFMAEGLLPNISSLYDSGATANLITHGRRLSPAVWTGIATGYRHARHGIVGWTLPDPSTGTTRLVQSGDRKKPALWQILSHYGKSCVAINWLASYPAEEVEGAIVSRVLDVDSLSVYPRRLAPHVMSIVDSSFSRMADREWFYGETEAVFSLAEDLATRNQPDLLMLYINCTDKAQHRHWAAYQPEEFDETWGITEDDIETGMQVLKSVWSELDASLGELLRVLDDDTAVLLVSDHGFKPRAKVSAIPMVNRILYRLGYLRWEDPVREKIDFAKTRAFVAGLDAYDPMVGIYINAQGRQKEGIVPPDSVEVLARMVARELAALRVDETGEPLFLSVGLLFEGGPRRLKKLGFDVYAEKSSVLRSASGGMHTTVGGESFELDSFFRIISDNSGNHAPRGVLIASGPQFNERTILPVCADSPYSVILTYVTGYSSNRDWIYGLLRRFGLLDAYTSVDVAPTVLYLLGLPYAEAMDGRPMDGILTQDLVSEEAAIYVEDFHFEESGQTELVGKPSEQTLDQLKALGYIQ